MALEGGGRACLRIRNEYAGASTARGSFTLAGSDGDPAALLAGAAYTGRVEDGGRLVLDGRGRQARFGTLPLGCSTDLRAPLEELRDAAGPRLRTRTPGHCSCSAKRSSRGVTHAPGPVSGKQKKWWRSFALRELVV